jgi:cation transport protein ChaC
VRAFDPFWGGSCLGHAFRVPAPKVKEAVAYLDGRELITDVYRPITLPVVLAGEMRGRRVSAYCYVVRRDHPHYAGRLSIQGQVRIIRSAHGNTGSCRDCLANTVAHLTTMGITEGSLHRILELVDRPADVV